MAASFPLRYVAMGLPKPGPSTSFTKVARQLEAPKDAELVVRVSACAVAFRDVLDRQGAFKFINQPTVLGHEFAGEVVAVGPSKSDINVGDKVVSLHWNQQQAWPSPLNAQGAVSSMFGLKCDGGYAQYATGDAGAFVPVRLEHSMTDAQLACIMSTFGTVWQGAVVRGGLQAGMKVLVTGASGGVGSAAVALAKAYGCSVTGVTSSTKKEPFLRELGCDNIVVSGEKGFRAPPHDVVLEAVGGPTFSSSLRATAPGGKLVLVGNVENSISQLPLGYCILNSIAVVGSDSIERSQLQDALLPFMVKHRLVPHVQEVLPMDRCGEAHDRLESRSVTGRLVLDPSSLQL